jgi:hypothetical protein
VIEARQLAKLEPLEGRADLALSDQDVEILSRREVRVTVHNIGAAAAENISVCMLDKGGKVVDRQTIARLAAPADLKPQSGTVNLKLVPAGQVLVDAEDRLPEIYEGNNRVAVKPPRGRFVYLR